MHLPDPILEIVQNSPLLMVGLSITLILSFIILLSSLILGAIIAIFRYFRFYSSGTLLDGYVILVRSIPLIMLLGIVHFAILPMLDIGHSFFLSAYVAFTLSTTAYFSEIIRAGLNAIRPEEYEGALGLGLTFHQRLWFILLPLAIQRTLPALVNQTVTLIKDTSLASIIGVIELTRAAEIIYERTLHEDTMLTLVVLIYFILCYGLSTVSNRFQWALQQA